MGSPGTRVDADISGFGVRFVGLDTELADRLRDAWRPYVRSTASPSALLELNVATVERAYDPQAYAPKAMRSVLAATHASFAMEEGEAVVGADGQARLTLVAGTGERRWFTLLNLFRACLAWTLPSRGALFLHAAGVVVEGKAFLLIGAEGAGKSTFARIAEEGGAQVISDDVVVVDARNAPASVVGAPLRSTHRVAFEHGRWPLEALLFPRHGAPAAIAPCSQLLAHARVAANLPFVADGIEADPRFGAALDALISAAACAELTFAPDPGFLDLLRDRP